MIFLRHSTEGFTNNEKEVGLEDLPKASTSQQFKKGSP